MKEVEEDRQFAVRLGATPKATTTAIVQAKNNTTKMRSVSQ